MVNEHSEVLRNEGLGHGLFEMTLRVPQIAASVEPGQFVHMELPTMRSSVLRRPFSIYDADAQAGTVDVLYQVVGAGTSEMTGWKPGCETTMIGPVGHGWTPPEGVRRALLVGGGVGAAPLFMLYRKLVESGVEVDVVLGASTKEMLTCRERYADVCGCDPRCATDDGTFGAKGFCTVCVEELLGASAGLGAGAAHVLDDQAEGASGAGAAPYNYAAVCGPEPMMRAVAAMTCAAGIPTQVSLERHMACGIGACLSCVCDTKAGKERVCVDGPVFNVEDLGW